jgi:hypothetical protein
MGCHHTTSLPDGVNAAGRKKYKTEAECLQACKEGACCEGATCSVKPQCQCQGTGKTFKGVGTTCEPNPCLSCCRFIDLSAGGPTCVPIGVGGPCTPEARAKVSPCGPLPASITVSGFGIAVGSAGGSISEYGDFDMSVLNGTYSTTQYCGLAAVDRYIRDLAIPLRDLGSTLSIYAWISPQRINLSFCPSGLVCYRVRVTARRQSDSGAFRTNTVLFQGEYESQCFAIASLPEGGNYIDGRTSQITCSGTFAFNPAEGFPLSPQTVTVSVAGNPLP